MTPSARRTVSSGEAPGKEPNAKHVHRTTDTPLDTPSPLTPRYLPSPRSGVRRPPPDPPRQPSPSAFSVAPLPTPAPETVPILPAAPHPTPHPLQAGRDLRAGGDLDSRRYGIPPLCQGHANSGGGGRGGDEGAPGTRRRGIKAAQAGLPPSSCRPPRRGPGLLTRAERPDAEAQGGTQGPGLGPSLPPGGCRLPRSLPGLLAWLTPEAPAFRG